MTFDEALRELGVDAATPPEEARRAYLRLLKTRKPEVDPAGFRQLREAYEIVKARDQAGVRFVLAGMAKRATVEAKPPPKREEAAADSNPDPDPNPDPDQDQDQDQDQDRAPDPGPAPRPVAAPPTYVAVPSANDPARFRELVRAGKHVDAARELGLALEDGVASFDSCDPLVPLAIELLLILHDKGELAASLALGRSVYLYLRETQGESRVVRGATVTKWAVARELDSLPADFPADLRSAFARAVLASDPSRAYDTAFAYRRAHTGSANKAAVMLTQRAPLLAKWYANRLSLGRGGATPAWRGRAGGWSVIGIIVFGVLRVFASTWDPALFTPPASERPAPVAPEPSASPPRTDVDLRTEAATEHMLLRLTAGDCAGARAAMLDVVREREGASASTATRAQKAIARVQAACRVAQEGGPP